MKFLTRWKYWLPGVALALSIAITILQFRDGNVFEHWSLQQQDINRALVTGIRSLRPQLRTAKSVLVVGLVSPFHPWISQNFLRVDLGYEGQWVAAVDPDGYRPPSPMNSVLYDDVRLRDYDLIVVFGEDGRLIAATTATQLRALTHGRTFDDGQALKDVLLGKIIVKPDAR